ncbi:fasciclin domain-containing protein [Winogradskyella sp.]|uniref:fasciclin domain-containing protein n=1 Tax=Winogradskyella sp. TaxID=1883156 RepID=UPI003BA8FA4C
MKIISKTFKLLTVFLLVLGVTGCSDDDDNNGPGVQTTTIIDVAAANGLTSLAAALEATGLTSTLQGTGPFTVFAPDNAAFTTLLTNAGLDLDNLSTAEEALVRNILLNHVIIGQNISSTDLVNLGSGYTNTGATGPNGANLSLYFTTTSGVVLNGQSTVSNPDLTATNGVIHVVNTVIDLPTIATFATTNSALSTLVAALQNADTGTPTVPWIDTVSNAEAGPFTVFAPTNDAFGNVLTELNLSGFGEGTGELNAATTDTVLTYHVVNGTNVQSSGLGALNGVIPTIGGDLDLDGTVITDANGRESNILATLGLVDIQGINGVVHVIDRVILFPLN